MTELSSIWGATYCYRILVIILYFILFIAQTIRGCELFGLLGFCHCYNFTPVSSLEQTNVWYHLYLSSATTGRTLTELTVLPCREIQQSLSGGPSLSYTGWGTTHQRDGNILHQGWRGTRPRVRHLLYFYNCFVHLLILCFRWKIVVSPPKMKHNIAR